MRRYGFILSLLAFLIVIGAVFFVLTWEKTLITHPKGIIAKLELKLIATNYLLMALIVIPTYIALFIVAWKYRQRQAMAPDHSNRSHGILSELLLWIVPSVVIAVMAVFTWFETHRLDPYRPIESDAQPLVIQVVALDWKWLFIYPEQGIATINFVRFPSGIPIHLMLSADGSPMNAFWIPQLSGQIYTMAGMMTTLHIMADEPGIYNGRASEINGEGYADMTFIAESISLRDFDNWTSWVKQSSQHLTASEYNELVQPSINHPVILYSRVDENLFSQVVKKYSHPMH